MDDYGHIGSDDDVVAAYRKGVGKGILKVMAKMGISTLQSYKGAQIFEAVGLGVEVVNRCFTDTESRVGGIGFGVLAEEIERRHELGFAGASRNNGRALPNPGDFHWRKGGARHMWDPVSVRGLRVAARTNSPEAYWRFARHANEENTRKATLRGLLRFHPTGPPVDLDQVEPEAEIVKRFATGAMSFGSISKEAHESLALAMNRIGAKSNSGEGGEDPARNVPDPDGGLRRSAIKQVASGRFGVTIEYLTAAEELQIKDRAGSQARGGGELPGRKVDDYIASIRHSTPGVGLIQPAPAPRHLLHRGHRPAHPRPEERQSAGAHQREAVRRDRRGHGGRGRGQGARRPPGDLGRQRRHGRLPAHLHQARGATVGARDRRGPPDPGDEQPALAGHRADGRSAQDGPGRGRRRAAGRGGVRILHRPADHAGLRS